MPNSALQSVFLYHGSIITLSGIVLGNLLALLLCWLQQRYGFITLPEDMYYISKAEVRLEWWHFALVDGGTFLVCFAILFIPLYYLAHTTGEGDTVQVSFFRLTSPSDEDVRRGRQVR